MRRPGFPEGVLVALIAALAGSIFLAVVPGLSGPAAGRAVIAGLGLAYVLYLLRCSHARSGRVVTLAAWLLGAGLSWALAADLAVYLGVHLGLIWLVRSLHHQPGPLAALADLGLHLSALLAGAWAYLHSGSVFLGIWSFFLVQALFVAIPGMVAGRGADTGDPIDPFETASRGAEAALRRLSTQR